MFPVSDGSVIAATTPIIVRESNISAMVNAAFFVIARSPTGRRDDPPAVKPVSNWLGVKKSCSTSRGCASGTWIATRSATARNDGVSFNVIPDLIRNLTGDTGSSQHWSDAETSSA